MSQRTEPSCQMQSRSQEPWAGQESGQQGALQTVADGSASQRFEPGPPIFQQVSVVHTAGTCGLA